MFGVSNLSQIDSDAWENQTDNILFLLVFFFSGKFNSTGLRGFPSSKSDSLPRMMK